MSNRVSIKMTGCPLSPIPCAVLQIQHGSSTICNAPPENTCITGYKVSKLSISIKERVPAKLWGNQGTP